jgi:hypothetical protein
MGTFEHHLFGNPASFHSLSHSAAMSIDTVPSTLKPPQITAALIQSAVAKHRTRADVLFFKAFMAGAMLSFGGLLSEIVSGGSGGVNSSNPGLVKVLSGLVFPVGLVMSAYPLPMLCGAAPMLNVLFPQDCSAGSRATDEQHDGIPHGTYETRCALVEPSNELDHCHVRQPRRQSLLRRYSRQVCVTHTR